MVCALTTGRHALSLVFPAPLELGGGSYKELSDCAGAWNITPAKGATINFNTVRVNGGAELLLVETENGALTAGVSQE